MDGITAVRPADWQLDGIFVNSSKVASHGVP